MGGRDALKTYAPHLTALLVLAAGAVLVLRAERSPVVVRPAAVTRLPAAAGEWQGDRIRFCQDERCGRSVLDEAADTPAVCPTCGAALGEISPGERALLPADTIIDHRLYRNAAGETVLAALVVSGGEQKSIHRPQQCLPAQGLVIEGSRVFEVLAGPKGTLHLMGLDLRRPGSAGQGDRSSFFAYWFFAGDRTTPSHLQRLYWMSRDRILRAEVDRWAYVSLLTDRAQHGEVHVARIARFMEDFDPALMSGVAD